jgi:hypothetical protein
MLKRFIVPILLVLGLGLFVFVIAQFGGIQGTLAVVGQVGWVGMAAFILNASLILAVPAVGWTILMRGEGLKVSLWTALKANFMGMPINFIAPTMFIGAEPLKLYYVAHRHGEEKARILATIIVCKFQEVGAILFVMIVAGAISLVRIDFGRSQAIVLVVAMAVVVLLFALLLYAFLGNFKPTVKAINLLARMGVAKRRLARARTKAEEMEQLIRLSFTKRWKTFVLAQAVTLLSAASILMRPWIFFHFATPEDPYLPTEKLCAIYVVTNLINSLPHTPGGLGIFEGGMVALFDFVLGLGKENAAAFSVVNRAADVFLLLLGAWLIIHSGLQAMARRVAKGEEKAPALEEAAGVQRPADAGPAAQ